LVGLTPYDREAVPTAPQILINRRLLEPDGAAARLRYLLSRPEGRLALPFLAQTGGVLQNDHHHLDVLDHTLLVLVNVEEFCRDPLRSMLDPAGFLRRAGQKAQEMGMDFARWPVPRPPQEGGLDLEELQPHLDRIERGLNDMLAGEGRL